MGHRDYLRPTDWLERTHWGVLAVVIATVAAYFVEGAAFGFGGEGLVRALALRPSDVGHGRLWQLLTHVLLHDPRSLGHILFNMLFLYWLGREVEIRCGTAWFFGLYVGGALLGGLLYTAGGYLRHDDRPMLGASDAVMAVAVVAAFQDPRRPFLLFFVLPVPLALMVGLFILGDLYCTVAGIQTGVANLAHLGGALFGYGFHRLVPGGEAPGGGFRLPRWRRRRRPDSAALDRQVDAILDKISREGLASLTPAERAVLEKASRMKRQRP